MEPYTPQRPQWRQRTSFHVGFVAVILLISSAFSLHHGLRTGRYALMNEKLQQGQHICELLGYELQRTSPDINALLLQHADGPLGNSRVKAVWYYRGGVPAMKMVAKDIPPVPGDVIKGMLDAPIHQNIPRRNWAYLISHPMGKISEGHFLIIHFDSWVPLKELIPFIPHPDWPLWGLVALLLGAYAMIIHSLTSSAKE